MTSIPAAALGLGQMCRHFFFEAADAEKLHYIRIQRPDMSLLSIWEICKKDITNIFCTHTAQFNSVWGKTYTFSSA